MTAVSDDVVLYRAVIDHTAICEACNASGCPIGARLRELSAVATVLRRVPREPVSVMCRGAELLNVPAAHGRCEAVGCGCGCHGGQ